jgi:hypothetical protein
VTGAGRRMRGCPRCGSKFYMPGDGPDDLECEVCNFTWRVGTVVKRKRPSDVAEELPAEGWPDSEQGPDGDRAGVVLSEQEEYDEPNTKYGGTGTPSENAVDAMYQAESLLLAADKDLYPAIYELLRRQMDPRISQATEVNATLAQVTEACGCGATYTVQMPAEFRDDVLKGVNTWRKFHPCGVRQVEM